MAEWSWTPELGERLRRIDLLFSIVTGVGGAALVAAGVVVPVRFLIVTGVVVVGLFVVGRLNRNRLTGFRASVSDGVLELADGRTRDEIDLREVSSIDIRDRNVGGGDRGWSVEAVTGERAVVHTLANVGIFWRLPESEVDELRRELRAQLERCQRWDEISSAPTEPAQQASGFGAGVDSHVGGDGPFEWRMPLRPNAERNRRRLFWGTIVLAVALAIPGLVSTWGELGWMLVSITVLPGLVCFFGLGLWMGYRWAADFSLIADEGELKVLRRGQVRQRIPLAGAQSVTVDATSQSHYGTAGTHARTTLWFAQIIDAGGEEHRVGFPYGLGTRGGRDPYVMLEAELRRRAGLTE